MKNDFQCKALLGYSFPSIIQTRPHTVTIAEIANPMKCLELISKGGKLIDVTYKF